MKITKHNWGAGDPPSNGLTCLKSYRAFASRDDATCSGCGASIPERIVDVITGNHQTWQRCEQAFDRLWHMKLRPMAGLACMVEEAQCQQ